MRSSVYRCTLLASLLVLAGCVPDNVADYDFKALQPPAPPVELTGFALEGEAQAGFLTAELFANRGGAHLGYNQLQLRVAENGAAVTEARIRLDAQALTGPSAGLSVPIEQPSTTAHPDGHFEAGAFLLHPDTTAQPFEITATIETLDGTTETLTFTVEARADLWVQQQGDLFASWVQPARPVVGQNPFEVAVYRWTGTAFEPVSGASADLYPYMDMGGGDGHSTPYGSFESAQNRYRWNVDFIMSGGWEMTVLLTPAAGAEQTFRFIGYTVYEP